MRLVPAVSASFAELDGLADDDHLAFWRVLARSSVAVADPFPPLRASRQPSAAMRIALSALASKPGPLTSSQARQRTSEDLRPFRIEPETDGFLTGYYEPVVDGSLERTATYTAPILSRPPGFDHSGPGAADRPGPPRSIIERDAEDGRYPAVVWLRDWIEVFMIHVQGSARVDLPDGRRLRLVYDGRNGQPYTSIGRILVDNGEIRASDMSLERLKAWVRRTGQRIGEPGRNLMWRNASYIFFRLDAGTDQGGPIGGQGLPLEALRSIAVDRTVWPYGLPFWIEAELPWRSAAPERFRRLMVGQDTGSAILGPSRADIFFGTGEAAGHLAGSVRHPCRMWVLLPAGLSPADLL